MAFALSRVQRGLEALYRIETEVEVEDFLVDDEVVDAIAPRRRPREQLLLSQQGDVGLFVCDAVLENLGDNDPADGLDDGNLGDFLLAVEGVSHFVYLAWRARADHQVSALELELQAEVDKYVTCVLADSDVDGRPWGGYRELRLRLFHDFEYEPDLDDEERSRYAAANHAASAYAAYLEREYLLRGRLLEMLAELRRFYRLSQADKLRSARLAA